MLEQCLILTVGTGTTGVESNLVQGLVNTIRQATPRWYCLVPSTAEDSQTTASMVAEELRNRPSAPELLRPTDQPFYSIIAPDNIWQCRQELAEIISICRERCPAGTLILNPTSGTKQMSAAALLAALDEGLDQVQFIAGPRRDGVVRTDHEQMLSFSARAYLGGKVAREAARAIASGAFRLAGTMLDPYRDLQPDLLALAQALAAWHRLDYDEAREQLQRLRRKAREAQPYLRRVDELQQCGANSTERTADVFASAERCFACGQPEEALARVYRTLEMAGKTRLQEQHHIAEWRSEDGAGSEYRLTDLPANVRGRYTRKADNGRILLNLYSVYDLLRDLRDPLGQAWRRQSGEALRHLVNQRQKTLYGHGTAPAQPAEVKEILRVAKDFLNREFAPDFAAQVTRSQFPTAIEPFISEEE